MKKIPVKITRIEKKGWEFPIQTSSFETISKKDLQRYKSLVYKSVPTKWPAYPNQIKHLVFYSEFLDKDDRVYYANIYLDGTCDACEDDYFEEYYQKLKRFTIAIHRS